MSEFGALFLKYYAINDTINRLLLAAPAPIDPDVAVARLKELYPELESVPNLREEIVVAAKAAGVQVKRDGHADGSGA